MQSGICGCGSQVTARGFEQEEMLMLQELVALGLSSNVVFKQYERWFIVAK